LPPCPAARSIGRAYIADAVARGARRRPGRCRAPTPIGAALIADDNPRRGFARLAARFNGSQPAIMAAVTGTNGKTSVAVFTRRIWRELGFAAASLGTLGISSPAGEEPGGLTTPDPATLHRRLAELAKAGVTHAAMEASSHGLNQYRLDGVRIAAAGFTNLTRDHLDYHIDMAAYAAAKLRLFTELLPAGGGAVINADDPLAPRLAEIARGRGHHLLTYGAAAGCDLRLERRDPDGDGQALSLRILGRPVETYLPLPGAFQAGNALCALGLVIACGGDPQAAVAALPGLQGVPGRLQRIGARGAGGSVYVDYAHTPDALKTILTALRPHAGRRLSVVFGCGGDRDAGKRPLMGRIAADLADDVVITDDNPRGENPAAIRRQILAACPGAREIGDRAEAIAAAVAALEDGDILVIAGKGHERGQIVGATTLPFDDGEVARQTLARLEGGRP